MHSGRFLARRSTPLGVILLSATLGASFSGHGVGPDRADARDGRERRMEGKAALALLEDGFAAVAEKVEPAVVTVTARTTMLPRRAPEGLDDSFSAPFHFPDRLNTPSPPRGTSSGSACGPARWRSTTGASWSTGCTTPTAR